MTNEQNSENKTFGRNTITLSRDEIMGTCNYMLDILAFQGYPYGEKDFESDYQIICDVMEQLGIDSTSSQEVKKLVDDAVDIVHPEDFRRLDKLDEKFVHTFMRILA